MKTTVLTFLLVAAITSLTSCSTSPSSGETTQSATAYEEGVPGGVYVETYTLDAVVKAIDPETRKVILTDANGNQETVKCGPDVINFDQIEVGDKVKVTLRAAVVLAMADEGALPVTAATTELALAPAGAKPGGSVVETQQYTATVSAIDLKGHKATLDFPDGSSRTFVVRKDVDLAKRKVGEKVAIQVQLGLALSVEKP